MSNIKSDITDKKLENSVKKPFNKKKWREQKYSVKSKVKRWEEHRKKQMTREYHKELKKSGFNVEKKQLNEKSNPKKSALMKAEFEFKKIQEAKQKKQEERQRAMKERTEAIKAYKEKKANRFKKLSQKTKKGQPLMKGRIELLLEKIEKEYAHQNT